MKFYIWYYHRLSDKQIFSISNKFNLHPAEPVNTEYSQAPNIIVRLCTLFEDKHT